MIRIDFRGERCPKERFGFKPTFNCPYRRTAVLVGPVDDRVELRIDLINAGEMIFKDLAHTELALTHE